ncbi:MAG: BatD family protein [Acidobacteriota bacterium]|nr:BatD family protein [Acidobacteriota bacterium]
MVARRAAWLLLLALAAWRAAADELIVDTRTLQMNGLVTITVSLEGAFAELDDVDVPVRNLQILGEPSVSSEYAWINGDVTRRKAFRFRARPLAPGMAMVGPLVLNTEDGQRETLSAISLQVLPDRASGSNDPEVVLRELQASGRDPLFVIAEIDKRSAFVGEPVIVTWWLYNAAQVQQWQISSVPKLEEFWTEERRREEQPERVFVGNVMMQRLPARRATLFPLRSGVLRIGGITVDAAVMRQIRSGPFATFEGELVENSFTSAPVEVTVKPLPPGPPVDAVGDLSLTCEPPVQRNGGPVVVKAALIGLGNVRAATPPHFDGPVAGRVQLEGGEVTVSRDERSFAMARQWRFLIFPNSSAPLAIPSLTMRIFDPATAQRRELRCTPSFVNAIMARPPEPADPAKTAEPLEEKQLLWPWLATAAILFALIGLIPRLRRELAIRREAREILRDATPAEIRARIDERMKIDVREQSDRGDAYRALRSLLDAAERDRDIAVDAEEEVGRRVREVVRFAGGKN